MKIDRKGITVYCGSGLGTSSIFSSAAETVGNEIARLGLPLIYGGGHMGMMGAVGRAVRAAGGETIAVIPDFMVKRGWNDTHASHTIITPSMHIRKETMASNAVGVIALPGGIGTWEELCEIITWRQLGLYHGNIVILNLEGYYDNFLAQFNRAVVDGFFLKSHLSLFCVVSDPTEAVKKAAQPLDDEYIPPKF